MNLSTLTAISPLDGRYAKKTEKLREIFSEFALMRFRVEIEIRWLQALSHEPKIKQVPRLNKKAQDFLNNILENFNEKDARRIKNIEKKINHDVKAIEYFLKEKFADEPVLSDVSEFIHFAATSEDINNLAYALILKKAREKYILPALQKMITLLTQMAHQYSEQAMLARTHGQAASPTTLGKELANVAARLKRQKTQFVSQALLGKCNGAVGNFNAHVITYPQVDWENLSKKFIKSLGLEYNAYTTQIEPHDYIAEYADVLARSNTILIDLAEDMWGYISLGYFKLKMKDDEVGSSTMPHKINPIDFENAEGNLSLANALFQHFSSHLPRSRWQRDLRDSTLLRNLGVAITHSLIAYEGLAQGFTKLTVDKTRFIEDLNQHWEILAEAIQTVLRSCQIPLPYEKLKSLTRGKRIEASVMREFIHHLKIPSSLKQQLLQLEPTTYLGNAAKLAKKV
jgi:adenylosuccinate lyase